VLPALTVSPRGVGQAHRAQGSCVPVRYIGLLSLIPRRPFYEKKRQANIAANEQVLNLLDAVRVGRVVHIPASVFPDEEAPAEGYWVGKTVSTSQGGSADIGIKVSSEPVFTRPRVEVYKWLV
jgi:hypothetical protein